MYSPRLNHAVRSVKSSRSRAGILLPFTKCAARAENFWHISSWVAEHAPRADRFEPDEPCSLLSVGRVNGWTRSPSLPWLSSEAIWLSALTSMSPAMVILFDIAAPPNPYRFAIPMRRSYTAKRQYQCCSCCWSCPAFRPSEDSTHLRTIHAFKASGDDRGHL